MGLAIENREGVGELEEIENQQQNDSASVFPNLRGKWGDMKGDEGDGNPQEKHAGNRVERERLLWSLTFEVDWEKEEKEFFLEGKRVCLEVLLDLWPESHPLQMTPNF